MKYFPFIIENSQGQLKICILDKNIKLVEFLENTKVTEFLNKEQGVLVGFKVNRELIQDIGLSACYCDLSQDCDTSLSLDAIAAHLGLKIDIPKIYVIKHLLNLRTQYLENKIELGRLVNLTPLEALQLTEPQLMARLLKATPSKNLVDDFETPGCIDWSLIPDPVKDFFMTGAEGRCEIKIKNLTVTYGQGGIHGAIPKYQSQSNEQKKLWLVDVSSMYPSIMAEYGYISRNVENPLVYKNLLETRVACKKANPKLANALKGPLNKTYGAMRSKFNPLYDPTMAFAVCITGQLVMTMLLTKLALVDRLKLVQANTDGVLVEFDAINQQQVEHLLKEWEERTKLRLEKTELAFLTQKDVSNYIATDSTGKTKAKGSMFAKGICETGAWRINNSNLIVAEAIQNCLTKGIDPAITINECDDPFKFQIIVNVSDKYEKVWHETFEGNKEAALTNRVFAAINRTFGQLYKSKNNNREQIANLPNHCMICNSTYPQIEDIDKSFYIDLANKQVKSFGAPTEKTEEVFMVDNQAKLNIYQKLALARKMFNEKNPKKTGWNDHMEFAYYQLEDIVPAQTEIFAEVGLMEQFTYVEEKETTSPETGETAHTPAMAISQVINVDNPLEQIVFQSPWIMGEPNRGQSVLQTYGAAQTYLRRYNKMQILDIVEFDEIDAANQTADNSTPKKKTTKPATPAKREQLQNALTNSSNTADEVLIGQIKKAMTTLKEEFAENEKYKEWVKAAPKPTALKSFTQKQAKDFLHQVAELREELSKGE